MHTTLPIRLAALLVVLAAAPDTAHAQSRPTHPVAVDTIADGFRVPKSIAVLSETDAVVVSHRYRLTRLNLLTGARTVLRGGPVAIVPRDSFAETGIFDVVPHRDFARNGRL